MTKCLENGKNCNDFTSNERLEYFESFQKLQKKTSMHLTDLLQKLVLERCHKREEFITKKNNF